MSDEECEKVLKELESVRPEKLTDKTKRLFEAIMTIADGRDKAKADLYEANNRINDLLDTIKLKEEQIEYIENEYGRTIEQKDKMIDWLVEEIHSIVNLGGFIVIDINKINTKEEIKKYFEERCK